MDENTVVIGVDMSVSKAERELKRLMKDIANVKKLISEAEAGTTKNKDLLGLSPEELEEAIAILKKSLAQLEENAKGFADAIDAAKANMEETGDHTSKLSTAFAAVKDKFAAAFGSAAKKAHEHTSSLAEAMERVGKKITNMMKNIFVFNLLTKALQGVRKSIGEIISQNAQASAALASLKAAFSNLVTPIINAVLPAFSAFVNGLARVINAIASLLGFSGGVTSTLNEEADAMSGLGGATKKANKQLASFDEINQLSSAEAGGGGGGAAKKIETPEVNLPFLDLLKPLDELIEKTKKWAKSLDFKPLKKSLDNLKDKFGELASKIGSALGWAYENILLPLGKWTIEEALPAVIDTLAKAFEFLSTVLDTLKEPAQWVWDNVLSPLANWTADAFIEILTQTTDLLQKFIDLINGDISFGEFIDSLSLVQELLLGIGIALAAIAVYKGISAAIDGVKTAIGLLTNPIGLVVAAIALLVTGIVELIKHWDDVKAAATNAWNAIKGAFSAAATWFYNTVIAPIANFFSDLWSNLKNGAQAAWDGITYVFSIVGTWFKNTFKKAWEGIVSIFSVAGEIFTDIKDGIVTAFKAIVNALIKGINKVVAIPFNAINSVLQSLHDIDILGVKPFKWVGTIAVPQIPYLAQGAVIPPNREFMAVLGDQKSGTNIETPLETMIQAFKMALADMGGGQEAVMVVDGEVFGKLAYKLGGMESKRVGVSLAGGVL